MQNLQVKSVRNINAAVEDNAINVFASGAKQSVGNSTI